jgi:hypothetical protein
VQTPGLLTFARQAPPTVAKMCSIAQGGNLGSLVREPEGLVGAVLDGVPAEWVARSDRPDLVGAPSLIQESGLPPGVH